MGFNVIDQVIVGLMGADAVAAVGLSNSIARGRCEVEFKKPGCHWCLETDESVAIPAYSGEADEIEVS
jgi:hypothetical protein